MMMQRLSLPSRGIVRELFLYQSHDDADAIAAADNNNIIETVKAMIMAFLRSSTR